MQALDRVHVMGQGDSLGTYLSRTYGPYDKLCILTYPPSPQSEPSAIPSAVQLSALLLVVTNHRPDYNLYEYNCYWYAGVIFEACKELFPGHQEECNKHGDRGKCRLNVPMLAKHSLSDICNAYNAEWKQVLQRRGAHQTQQVGISQNATLEC